MSLRRIEAEKRGRRAETMAAWFLRLKAYRILARDFKTPVGEIDLIARRGRIIAFVEVKRRRDLTQGLEAVTPRAQARIMRAAQAFIAGRPDLAQFDLRFDVIVIDLGFWPHHVHGAWTS
jgi:putative endonuclease